MRTLSICSHDELLAEQLSGQWQMKLCPSCGKLFVPRVRRDQKTCSGACRKRKSRKGKARQ